MKKGEIMEFTQEQTKFIEENKTEIKNYYIKINREKLKPIYNELLKTFGTFPIMFFMLLSSVLISFVLVWQILKDIIVFDTITIYTIIIGNTLTLMSFTFIVLSFDIGRKAYNKIEEDKNADKKTRY